LRLRAQSKCKAHVSRGFQLDFFAPAPAWKAGRPPEAASFCIILTQKFQDQVHFRIFF